MTESKFKTVVGGNFIGGEMVHFGGKVTSYPANCLDRNVHMYHYHLAFKKFSEAQWKMEKEQEVQKNRWETLSWNSLTAAEESEIWISLREDFGDDTQTTEG